MVTEIAKILNQVDQIKNWSINLVKMNVSKKDGVKYSAEELSDFDGDGIVIEKYVISKKNLCQENSIFLKSINNEYMIEPKV